MLTDPRAVTVECESRLPVAVLPFALSLIELSAGGGLLRYRYLLPNGTLARADEDHPLAGEGGRSDPP
jgi:hypothetical protein